MTTMSNLPAETFLETRGGKAIREQFLCRAPDKKLIPMQGAPSENGSVQGTSVEQTIPTKAHPRRSGAAMALPKRRRKTPK
jgi:hypothetical protein